MATLADELLNDFEDSGSEGGGERTEASEQDGHTQSNANGSMRGNEAMVLDGDEEEEVEDDEDTITSKTLDGGDGEDTKAKVERMQLRGVADVQNVARLMKTLEPVLEVSDRVYMSRTWLDHWVYLLCVLTDLTSSVFPENITLSEPPPKPAKLRRIDRG